MYHIRFKLTLYEICYDLAGTIKQIANVKSMGIRKLRPNDLFFFFKLRSIFIHVKKV